MAKNDIKTFIADLKRVKKNVSIVCDDAMDRVVREILTSIGEATAYDTGKTRDVIAKIMKEHLGQTGDPVFIRYMTRYEHWRRSYGARKDDTSYTFEKTTNGKYAISIIGDGFYGQAEGGKVSIVHPRGTDDAIMGRHVDVVMDRVNAGQDDSVNFVLDEIIDAMVEAIETGRLTKPDKKDDLYD
jgi:hypothetical protein